MYWVGLMVIGMIVTIAVSKTIGSLPFHYIGFEKVSELTDFLFSSVISAYAIERFVFGNGAKKGEHDWYVSNVFDGMTYRYQVYFKCKKCGAFDENEGDNIADMLQYQTQDHLYDQYG